MVNLECIIEYFHDVKIMHGNALREDLFLGDSLFNICKDLHISQNLAGSFDDSWFYNLPWSFTHTREWHTVKNSLAKYFKKNLDNILELKFKDHPKFVIGHYIESLYAFERSIFWYFNFMHNLDPFNQIASEQALYYSEFFSIVSISRFLGGSLSYTPLSLFKIKLDWENEIIIIRFGPSIKGIHKGYGNLFFEVLEGIDFKNEKYLETLKKDENMRKKGFLMIDDRVENVYDLSSRMSDPFKNAYFADLRESSIRASKSWNFLEGLEDLYSKVGYKDTDGDLADYLYSEYSGEGYRQAHIGEYWKFLIFTLKKINGTEKYLDTLTWKISRFEECETVKLDSSTKEILLKWFKQENNK